jgi:hypothetical protein
MGTISIVDGKLKFDIPNKDFLEGVIKGFPEDDPEAFINILIARFAHSSSIFLKREQD